MMPINHNDISKEYAIKNNYAVEDFHINPMEINK